MLGVNEINAIAQKIVDISKATSRRDTGFLRRSISYTVEKNVYIFVEVFYGQFGADGPKGINSKLEKNAKSMMPTGVRWRMRYTDINRTTLEEGKVQTGGNSLGRIFNNLRQSTTAVTNLINRIRNTKEAIRQKEALDASRRI